MLAVLMYGTARCGSHGFRGEGVLSVSRLMEAIDTCGMASLDTSSMDVGMTVFSHYESIGNMSDFQSN